MNDDEVKRMATSGIAVAHCPSSNMRLASGIAPIQSYLSSGVKVGLGVDGSASNDSSHILAEARQAMLISRLGSATDPEVHGKEALLSARQALEMATLGGAKVLGRTDVGALRPGMCADFIAIDLNRIEFAGAQHDPVSAVVFCHPVSVDYNYVHGKPVVAEGKFLGLEIEDLIDKHNQAARQLIDR
jgi:cytosine/adenosine deaminase-related metal-dependent hydrolase